MTAETGESVVPDDLPGLLIASHTGDTVAFEKIYRYFAPITLRYLRSTRLRGAPESDVEDVAAETWADAWQGVKKAVPDKFQSWLITIATRRSGDYIRRRIAERGRHSDVDDETVDPPDESMIDVFRLAEMRGSELWLRQLLADAVVSLPEKYQPVLRERINTRGDAAELAARLQLGTRQATRALSDGLPLLRDCMVLTLMARGHAGQPCDRFRKLVADNNWRDGPLGDNLRETLTRHVAHCDPCNGVRTTIVVGLRYLPAFLGPAVLAATLDRVWARLGLTPGQPASEGSSRMATDAAVLTPDRRRGRRLVLLALMLIVLVVPVFGAFLTTAATTGLPLASGALTGCQISGVASTAGGAHLDAVAAPGPDGASRSRPFVVASDGAVGYQVRTGAVITNHHWHVDLYGVTVASGSAVNGHHVRGVSGSVVVSRYLPFRLTGLYYVSGGISGTGGACSGAMWLKLTGNPIGTVPFWTAVALLEIGVIMLWWSRSPSREVVV